MQARKRTIDRSSGIPLYKQIKEILIAEIKDVDCDRTRPFSTEEELIRRFHVSRAPVRQALKELADEGYVYRERAKGTFPAQEFPVRPPGLAFGGLVGYLREQGIDTKSQVLDVGRIVPDKNLCDTLGLEPSDKVLKVSRLIYFQGKPLAWAQTYLNVPMDFQPDADELEKAESVFVLLESNQGIYISRGDHQIWASTPNEEEEKNLGLKQGDSVLIVETKLYTRNNRLVGWRRAVHKEGYKFAFTVNR